MDHGLPILIVSCRPENRKMLMRVFDGLPIDSYAAPTVAKPEKPSTHTPFPLFFAKSGSPMAPTPTC